MSADTLEMMFRAFRLPTMASRFAEMIQSAEEHASWWLPPERCGTNPWGLRSQVSRRRVQGSVPIIVNRGDDGLGSRERGEGDG